MSGKSGYNGLQIALHWLIALLIVVNYLVSEGMPEFFDGMLEGKEATGLVPTVHVYVGVAVLVLAALRLVVRLISGAPEAPGVPGSLGVKIAGLGHLALYILMLGVPALGAIAWFGQTELTADAHVIAMNVMMLLALGHALVALFHQYVLKDRLLLRMMRPE